MVSSPGTNSSLGAALEAFLFRASCALGMGTEGTHRVCVLEPPYCPWLGSFVPPIIKYRLVSSSLEALARGREMDVVDIHPGAGSCTSPGSK